MFVTKPRFGATGWRSKTEWASSDPTKCDSKSNHERRPCEKIPTSSDERHKRFGQTCGGNLRERVRPAAAAGIVGLEGRYCSNSLDWLFGKKRGQGFGRESFLHHRAALRGHRDSILDGGSTTAVPEPTADYRGHGVEGVGCQEGPCRLAQHRQICGIFHCKRWHWGAGCRWKIVRIWRDQRGGCGDHWRDQHLEREIHSLYGG